MLARAPLYCGRNLVPTLLAPSFRHDRAGHWLGGVRRRSTPQPPDGGDARADVVDRRRWLRRPLDRLGAERGRARARADRRARGVDLRRRPERPQRRLRQRFLAPGEPALRALRRPRRARGLRARGRSRWRRSAPGREREGVDVGFRRGGHLKVATSARPGRGLERGRARLRSDRVRRPSTRRSTPPRRADGATRRSFAAARGCRAARPCSRRSSPSACAPALLARGVDDLRAHAGAADRPRGRAAGSWSRPPPAPGCGRRPPCSPSTPRPPGCARCAPRLAVSSTHMIVTEPVPDVLADLGWTGGEAISTARRYLHYFRTTDDGRIAFGGGGRLAYGARLGGRIEVDAGGGRASCGPRSRASSRACAGAGSRPPGAAPSTSRRPTCPSVGSLAGDRIHYVCGFTGNGVGPAHLTGRMLAALALDRRSELTRLGAGRAGPAAGAARAAALPRRQRGARGAAAQGGPRGPWAARRRRSPSWCSRSRDGSGSISVR